MTVVVLRMGGPCASLTPRHNHTPEHDGVSDLFPRNNPSFGNAGRQRKSRGTPFRHVFGREPSVSRDAEGSGFRRNARRSPEKNRVASCPWFGVRQPDFFNASFRGISPGSRPGAGTGPFVPWCFSCGEQERRNFTPIGGTAAPCRPRLPYSGKGQSVSLPRSESRAFCWRELSAFRPVSLLPPSGRKGCAA